MWKVGEWPGEGRKDTRIPSNSASLWVCECRSLEISSSRLVYISSYILNGDYREKKV